MKGALRKAALGWLAVAAQSSLKHATQLDKQDEVGAKVGPPEVAAAWKRMAGAFRCTLCGLRKATLTGAAARAQHGSRCARRLPRRRRVTSSLTIRVPI